MLAECKPSNALIGSEPFIRLPSARRAFFWTPRLGMTRRVCRAGATPAAFFWPVRFQIRYGWPLRRSRAKSPPRRCLARARCNCDKISLPPPSTGLPNAPAHRLPGGWARPHHPRCPVLVWRTTKSPGGRGTADVALPWLLLPDPRTEIECCGRSAPSVSTHRSCGPLGTAGAA